MAANSVPSGCTGRGRGVVSKSVEPPGLARGRGRGVGDAPAENPVPGVGSLKINGDGNGYDTDARTALETVTEKPGNMSEVTTVLNKWLDLAEANEDIGEAVARSACELMAHGEYGDKIREITLGRIFQMFKECSDQKIKSTSTLVHRFSFMSYMYLIQRHPDSHKRFDIYIAPLLLFTKEILKHKLTEDVVKILAKQISINGIALNSTAEGRAELEQIFISIRETLLLDSIEAKLRPYLLFLCDIQAANYKPLAENLMKFYSKYLDSCQRYKPSDIDVKLYGTK